MRYTPTQYAKALLELVAEAPRRKHREVIREFFYTLSAHGALSALPDIVREVGSMRDSQRGVRRVSVRSMARESERAIKRKLHFKAEVLAVKDARLLGGAVIELDDVRVDNSIAKRMGRIREALTK